EVELVGVLDELETLTCQLPVQGHRMLTRLQAETTAKAMGAKSWRDVLAIRWRISPGEAGRRLDEAATLGPRQALSGAPLKPVLACTAIAQAHGLINREHVGILRQAMERIPPAMDASTCAQIEADLVRTAMGVGPRNSRTTPTEPCSCSTRTAPYPTTPNARVAAARRRHRSSLTG
ncbi:MAG: hypothetical protein QOH82_1542, partial [Mycobacterium sp.]|nr:hypothetical protein [Mycobacterium sp.]